MNFSLSTEQAELRDLARQILSERMTDDRVRELRSTGTGFDRELWQSLAAASLLGACLPENAEGMGFGILELTLLLEAQGRTLAPLPLAPALAMAALPIARFGCEEQKQRLLPGFACGGTLLSAGFHEVSSVEVTSSATRAEADGSGWRLTGEKTCVPIADIAERILVTARSGPQPSDVGLFLLDPTATGVELEAQLATNGESQFRILLDGAHVDAADVLGDPRDGAPILEFARSRGLVAYAALQLGVIDEALRRTAEYTTTRKQFGKPIGSFQAVQLRAADAYIDIECLRSTLWQAAWMLDDGRDATREVAVAKWWACRGGQRVVHTAMHLHGGMSADVDHPIHHFFLWAKQAELALGGAASQLQRIGAELVA